MGFAGVLLGLAVPIIAACARWLGRIWALFAAAASLGVAVLLASNVFGEDDYRGNGDSRWETRESNAHALFVLEAILGVTVAVGFLLVAFRPRWVARIGPLLIGAAFLEAIGAWVVLVAFNAN